MKKNTHTLKFFFAVIAISFVTTACVSGPDEKQAEAIETANNALSSGVNHYNNSKHELAISYFKNALRDFRSIDHQYGIASSCLNLAKTYISIGNINTAAAYLTQAKRIIKNENIKNLSNHLAIIESSIAIEKNQIEKAKKILSHLLNNEGNNSFTLAAIQNRTRIAHAQENKDEAIQWTNTFENKIKSNKNQTHKARLARFKANLSDDASTKNKYFNTALNIYRKQTNRPGIAATLQEWGDALIQKKQNQDAKDKLQRALYIRQSLQDKKNSLKILNSLAKINNSNKINLWVKKLQDKQFKQWDGFIAVFNQFPE